MNETDRMAGAFEHSGLRDALTLSARCQACLTDRPRPTESRVHEDDLEARLAMVRSPCQCLTNIDAGIASVQSPLAAERECADAAPERVWASNASRPEDSPVKVHLELVGLSPSRTTKTRFAEISSKRSTRPLGHTTSTRSTWSWLPNPKWRRGSCAD